MKQRIYVSGPISGIKGQNVLLFDSVTATLRKRGYDVINPQELAHNMLSPDRKPSYSAMMATDLEQLLTASAVVLLPGWQHSRGSIAELQVALIAGLDIYVWESRNRMHRITEANNV